MIIRPQDPPRWIINDASDLAVNHLAAPVPVGDAPGHGIGSIADFSMEGHPL
jgi:hypothetical protein